MQSGASAALWERLADKSLAVMIAVAVAVVGFWWHRKWAREVFDFIKSVVIDRLDRIERKVDELLKK